MPNVFSYASPEQVFEDKAKFARRGIATGKPVVILEYTDGLLFLAENPSTLLHKVSEIYDRIAFAGVGKYSEYEQLRISGIRFAELTGYQYAREDVTARALANQYGQMLDQIFKDAFKPFEVEIVVAEVGETPEQTEIYRVDFTGRMQDVDHFLAIGGQADALMNRLKESYTTPGTLADTVNLGAEALRGIDSRELPLAQIEAAVLDRTLGRRKFRRLEAEELERLLA